jgi:hypothetical protein
MKDRFEYDVFVSYASEERAWVKENLYEPLLSCRTARGDVPTVFFDVEEMKMGKNFMQALAAALEASRKIILVYSPIYFSKEMCLWEMLTAIGLDPIGRKGILKPLMLDSLAIPRVPAAAKPIHYMELEQRPDWFASLSAELDLKPPPRRLSLEFLDQPPRQVDHRATLPPLRVALRTGDNTLPSAEETISILLEHGDIEGRHMLKTDRFAAEFRDLQVLSDSTLTTRLIARAPSYEPAVSDPFTILVRAADVIRRAPPPAMPAPTIHRISSRGEAVFLENETAVVVIEPDRMALHSALKDLPLLCEISLSDPPRTWRRSGDYFALADWGGSVHLLAGDGFARSFSVAGNARGGFHVPGDLAFAGNRLYAGYWNGALVRLDRDGEHKHLFNEPHGVHLLAALPDPKADPDDPDSAHDLILVAGLDGRMHAYRDGSLVQTLDLRGTLHLIKALGTGFLAVGAVQLYQIDPTSWHVLIEDLPFKDVSAVFGECNRPVVVDALGNACRFDADLLTSSLRVLPGAVPMSADDEGRYVVWLHPDSSRTFTVCGRTAVSHRDGTFAASASGGCFAIGDSQGIRLFSIDALREIIDHRESKP